MRVRPITKPPVNGSYPFTFVTANPSWTTAGTAATIESITNLTLFVPAMGREVSYSICLPAGYTAGSATYPFVLTLHGASSFPTSGPGIFGPSWPAAYHDAVSNSFIEPHITGFLNLGEYSMGTNLPNGDVMMESAKLELMKHIHATYRTKGLTLPRYNALMGFSMGARAAMYWLFKYAKMYYDGVNPWCWGGAAVFGAPLYSPTYDYAANAGSLSWAAPCISPSGAYTAQEIAVWATKCAQTYATPAALAGKLVRVGYGGPGAGGDPVLAAAGNQWNTDMNALGIDHEFVTGLTLDTSPGVGGGGNIGHDVNEYFGSTNVTRPWFSAIQRVFNQNV